MSIELLGQKLKFDKLICMLESIVPLVSFFTICDTYYSSYWQHWLSPRFNHCYMQHICRGKGTSTRNDIDVHKRLVLPRRVRFIGHRYDIWVALNGFFKKQPKILRINQKTDTQLCSWLLQTFDMYGRSIARPRCSLCKAHCSFLIASNVDHIRFPIFDFIWSSQKSEKIWEKGKSCARTPA